jgi:hypothetical protein
MMRTLFIVHRNSFSTKIRLGPITNYSVDVVPNTRETRPNLETILTYSWVQRYSVLESLRLVRVIEIKIRPSLYGEFRAALVFLI